MNLFDKTVMQLKSISSANNNSELNRQPKRKTMLSKSGSISSCSEIIRKRVFNYNDPYSEEEILYLIINRGYKIGYISVQNAEGINKYNVKKFCSLLNENAGCPDYITLIIYLPNESMNFIFKQTGNGRLLSVRIYEYKSERGLPDFDLNDFLFEPVPITAPINELEIMESGQQEDGQAQWNLYENGLLVISGTGKTDFMKQNVYELDEGEAEFEREWGDMFANAGDKYTYYSTPWNNWDVKKVVIQEGITDVDWSMFAEQTIGGVTTSFNHYPRLKEIVFPKSFSVDESYNGKKLLPYFSGCPALEDIWFANGDMEFRTFSFQSGMPKVDLTIHAPKGSLLEKSLKQYGIRFEKYS